MMQWPRLHSPPGRGPNGKSPLRSLRRKLDPSEPEWRDHPIILIYHEDNTLKSKSKSEVTSKSVGTIASKLLRDPKTPKDVKRVAGTALTQRPNKPKK